MDKVFVVTGKSESGDDCFPAVFDHKPSEAELSAFAHECDGDEFRDGCGYDGSYVHIEVNEVEIKTA